MSSSLASAIEIRPVQPADAPALVDFVAALTPASRRQRFHGGIHAAAWHRLSRQMTEVDGHRHAAWVACAPSPDGAAIVGEARYVRAPHDDAAAELAISVADDWHGRGVADRLMGELLGAAQRGGIRRLVADVLTGNARMLAFARRHGFGAGLGTDDDGAGLRLERELAPAPPPRRTWAQTLRMAIATAASAVRNRLALQRPTVSGRSC